MALDDDNNTIEIPDQDESLARGFTIFFVGLIVLLSLSLFIFYATVRSRSIGLANGYLKAIEIGYQTGEYHVNKDMPENSFESGIYRVKVSSIKLADENGPVIIRVEIKDKFFSVTHYTEELKLIPTLNDTER